ncbi:hypothetical protein GCM10020000_76330 [Streptomyces olivoverticillatus]
MGGLEEVPDGQFGAQDGADAGEQAGGEQGVPAEGEEVPVDADPGQAEDFGEEGAEDLLALVAGGLAKPRRRPSRGAGRAARSSLPLGGQRQVVEGDEEGGHHVAGQQALGVGAQRGLEVRAFAGAGGVVGEGVQRGAGGRAGQEAGADVVRGPGEDHVQAAVLGRGGPGGAGAVAEAVAEAVQLLRVDRAGGCRSVQAGEGGCGAVGLEQVPGPGLVGQAQVGHTFDAQPCLAGGAPGGQRAPRSC